MNRIKLLLSVLVLLLSFSPALLRAQEEILETSHTTQKELEEEIFVVVEYQPKYPGGDKARMSFLMKNIKYPTEAMENGETGTVYVSFIVEKDGSLSDISIIRGVSPSLDAETIRVVSLMPNWLPGKQRGKLVRVRFNMPVRYSLRKGCTPDKDMQYKSARALYKKGKYSECKKKLEELGMDYPHHEKGLKLMKKVLKKLNKK